jgi:hypothetical protein
MPTHMFQSRSINDKHKSSRPITVIRAQNVRKTGVNAAKGERSVTISGLITGPAGLANLRLQKVVFREELFCSVDHLLVHRETIPVPSDNDDVVVLVDQVRAVSDS